MSTILVLWHISFTATCLMTNFTKTILLVHVATWWKQLTIDGLQHQSVVYLSTDTIAMRLIFYLDILHTWTLILYVYENHASFCWHVSCYNLTSHDLFLIITFSFHLCFISIFLFFFYRPLTTTQMCIWRTLDQQNYDPCSFALNGHSLITTIWAWTKSISNLVRYFRSFWS